MSIVAVHGPHSWGQPFFTENDDLIVNLLGPLDIEVKSKTRQVVGDGEAYAWNFGDGTPIVVNGYEVRHIYSAPGEKVITVEVNTEEGVVTQSITVNLPGGDGELLQLPKKRRKAA